MPDQRDDRADTYPGGLKAIKMLALNIGTAGSPVENRAAAEKWWTITDDVLDIYGKELVLAVADNTIAGVFRVRDYRRDPASGNQVVFDLAPAPEWEWAIGKSSPVHWGRHDRARFKKAGNGSVADLLVQHPDYRPAPAGAAHRWMLGVGPDTMSATVRCPGQRVVVTALGDGEVRLELLPAKKTGGPGQGAQRRPTA